jgi:hypothetical protein
MSKFRILKDMMKELASKNVSVWRRFLVLMRFLRLAVSREKTIGDMMKIPANVAKAYAELIHADKYDPDEVVDKFNEPVMNPVIAFHEAIRAGADHSKLPSNNPFKGKKISIAEAFVFEAHYDEFGKIVRDPKTLESIEGQWKKFYRIRRVKGTEAYRDLIKKAEAIEQAFPKKLEKAKETKRKKIEVARKLVEDGFLDASFLTDMNDTNYDPNQYTEYTPIMGGPFFRQLYLYDMLRQHALAFEHWNHNPLGKQIINLLVRYAFGRRFEVRIDDETQKNAWEETDRKYKLIENVCQFWSKESLIYGEFMLDKEVWRTIDPSTIWDIITNPENVDDKYYFYQQYASQYQMFTGYQVPGEPGAEDVPATEYVLKQIPAFKVLHWKFNCVSNEKRGRSVLFPILGWLKRVKDLYNAQVVREWLLSCFVWDVTIKGNAADASAYAAQYASMPPPGSVEVHNESVTRTPMPAISGTGTSTGGDSVANSLLSFIATAMGIPKEFFNVSNTGGGSRAAALTSAEPFTKVIEDMQAVWESIMTEIFSEVMAQNGLPFEPGDVEFLFPSVTKDTTSETIKNLQQCEAQGWLSKRTCAEMAAKELNITSFDFESEQYKIADDHNAGFDQVGDVLPPAGRFGADSGVDDEGGSDIHGDGKVDLASQLKTL